MRELEKYQKTEAYKHFTRKVQEKQKGKRHRGEIWLEKLAHIQFEDVIKTFIAQHFLHGSSDTENAVLALIQ